MKGKGKNAVTKKIFDYDACMRVLGWEDLDFSSHILSVLKTRPTRDAYTTFQMNTCSNPKGAARQLLNFYSQYLRGKPL